MPGLNASDLLSRSARQQVGIATARWQQVLQHPPSGNCQIGTSPVLGSSASKAHRVRAWRALGSTTHHLQPGAAKRFGRIVVDIYGHGRQQGHRLGEHHLMAPVQRMNLEQAVGCAMDLLGQQAIAIEYLAASAGAARTTFRASWSRPWPIFSRHPQHAGPCPQPREHGP